MPTATCTAPPAGGGGAGGGLPVRGDQRHLGRLGAQRHLGAHLNHGAPFCPGLLRLRCAHACRPPSVPPPHRRHRALPGCRALDRCRLRATAVPSSSPPSRPPGVPGIQCGHGPAEVGPARHRHHGGRRRGPGHAGPHLGRRRRRVLARCACVVLLRSRRVCACTLQEPCPGASPSPLAHALQAPPCKWR